MSRSYWLPIIALGGCLGFTAFASDTIKPNVSGDKNAVSQQPAKEPSATEYIAESSYDAVFWRDNSGQAKTYEAICKNPKDREYADLCQQWRTAEETKRAAEWAEPLFWANIATLGGLIITIFITAIGTKAAIRNAQAAEAANITVRAQTKAYIDVRPRPPYIASINGKRHIISEIEIKNIGETPARNFSYAHSLGIFDLPVPPDKIVNSIVYDSSSILPVQHPVTLTASAEFSLEDEAAVIAGHKAIIRWGITRYADIFGEVISEPFNFKMSGVNYPSGWAHSMNPGISKNSDTSQPKQK